MQVTQCVLAKCSLNEQKNKVDAGRVNKTLPRSLKKRRRRSQMRTSAVFIKRSKQRRRSNSPWLGLKLPEWQRREGIKNGLLPVIDT